MTWAPPLRALFRVAAGPRIGYGHLVRARVLAQALGILHPRVSVRGPREARATARRLGMAPVAAMPAALVERDRPDVLILDDPAAAAASRWCRMAQRVGVPVVSVHDLGLAFCGADLAVDGSLVSRRDAGAGRMLCGPRYTIVDPVVATLRRVPRQPPVVLIALGGGPRLGVAARVAVGIRRRLPGVEVRVAGGFSVTPGDADGIRFLGPLPGLAGELATCAVAVTGGGVTMYEAAALRTPLVAWPVVRAQQPAVAAFVRHGLACAVGPGPDRPARAAAAVESLLGRGRVRPGTPEARALDGRGAARVAAAIRALVRRSARRAA